MRPAPLSTLPLLLPVFPVIVAACSDQSLGRFNAAPQASITSHGDGEEALEGYVITVRGSVSDADDAEPSLRATWYLGDTVACEAAAPADDGTTSCAVAPTPDRDKITLEVRDPDNAAGSDSVTLSVSPTRAPEATIEEPTADGRYYTDQKLTFQARVSDAEDDPTDLLVAWASDIDGVLTLDGGPDSSGLWTASGYLSAGQHALTLTVTDLSGKTGADQVIIEVGEPDQAPSCAITSPEDGGRGRQGDELLLAGWADDADQPADTLAWSWSSSLDGVLATGSPTSDGGIQVAWSSLSPGAHVLTLSVTDEPDQTCTDSVAWTVDNPPTVQIDQPLSGSKVNEGDTVVFVATVHDDEDPADSLALSWDSDIDGVWSTAGADSSGTATTSTDGLSPGTHRVTLQATDSDGGVATDSVTLIVNQAPSAPVVSITPATPTTSDDLGVVIDGEATDPEGDSVAYRYTWFRDGVEATDWTSTTVGSDATARDEVWTVEVVADDGSAEGPAGTAEVTIANTPPTVEGLSVSPATVHTDDTVTASATASDIDGDAVTVEYDWYVDGVLAGTGATLSGETAFDKGDVIEVVATPDDGTDLGDSLRSSPLTVDDSAPEITDVRLSPATVYTNTTVSAAVSATDADGDAISLSYQWLVDGGTVSATGSSLDGETWFDKGQELWVRVTPSDGTETGTAVDSDTVIVLNSPPAVASVTLSPTTVYTDDTVTASVVATDEDDDALSMSYEWFVNGTSTGTTGSALSGDSWFSKHDTVAVRVTPSDDETSGTPVDSATVTVRNSPPSSPSVAIDPASPYEADSLWCSLLSEATDADGDSVDHRFSWEVDDAAYTATTTTAWPDDTVPADVVLADETWTCTVVADDGEELGGSDSDTVTITAALVDYTGLYNLDSAIDWSCAYGLVSLSFDSWYIVDSYPDVSVTSTSSAQPGTMTGSFPTPTTIAALREITGTCTETYQVSGTFTDSSTFEGTLDVTFTGRTSSSCLDCTAVSFDFVSRR